ncbi:alpha/beta hydrolase [Stenotrophomonas maltophilia]|uniref:alpha/beta fold hydrolase n=1 Tax=Stenotrophomonas maltophilia TaxID=40324 RepID=UPI0019D4D82F|nr:alpha/beta hydrolase [Stenotrophomonas maltophilia]MBN7829964.1 alpha/beta hydrolase [Stenotrophomonas maltophilia]MBN7835152.1 alpha/beta hydrolase [Stenotrophomonas maltophilia]MBN7860269.1 alpha/beta hydrolase [Stenotrophomonas maltophilia]MBN7919451.1 alpha/beta hydrolase [Stenotrophomonas maltophilia]MBO2844811.1 alpha/beta hydrolase [Stenotrophomonas maltophilia]
MPASRIRLHVEDTGGDGRPVILIHGWPLSADAWKTQVAILRDAQYRVISYDRRGFGRSDKPAEGYDYDTLAADLAGLIEEHDLRDVTLVGFSMGGGEVARYVANHGQDRVHSVVFAAAVPPFLLRSDDNPQGPLTQAKADEMRNGLEKDREAFFDDFTRDFFSANGQLMVTEDTRQAAIALCHQSDQAAALGCMKAFATTDFRDDLKKITVPTLVLHGDSDAIVPFEGSGQRTHEAIAGSEVVILEGAPHGCNTSHADRFNLALLNFLKR